MMQMMEGEGHIRNTNNNNNHIFNSEYNYCTSNCNGNYDYDNSFLSPEPTKRTSSFGPSSASSSAPTALSGGGGGGGCIEHKVSKFDTLAGVAIKYGVEVADIKRMNGLVTDLQMFALKTLHIPPSRHPPSACLSNGSCILRQSNSEQAPPRRANSDIFDSFQSLRIKTSQQKASAAISYAEGYSGLLPTDSKINSEGFEMTTYKNADPVTASAPPLSHHFKPRTIVNDVVTNGNGLADDTTSDSEENDSHKWCGKLVRRPRSEVDFTTRTPEMLIKEDNSCSSLLSAITAKGLALRSKVASLTPVSQADSQGTNGPVLVRKSMSTSSLNDQESSSSSFWAMSKWSLKPDLQALTSAAIARPILEVLPKPLASRKNKGL